ncbi:hypothetical protein KY310_01695 [Candidatus Woesearchaeota archaeon]|nr:hypothetical protein [Candidatus Woesearchaeota archaeon]
MGERKYDCFRFGVAVHDSNGFWYSPHLMTFDDLSALDKQWAAWKRLEKRLEKDPKDPREMLIDQYHRERQEVHDTIVIPSADADRIQREIFGEEYERIKFDIWSIEPPTYEEIVKVVETLEGKE